MKKPIVFSLFNSSIHLPNFPNGHLSYRLFPDDESYIRFDDDIEGKEILFLDSLDHPNKKTLPLLFAAKAAKDLGAKSVGLAAPYLAYMRQDKRFNPGEAITSIHFAKLISESFDWILTIDPHLHRYKSLNEIYAIPTYCLSATELISDWILKNIQHPVLIGPDTESDQWVAQIARAIKAPYTVLKKVRRGDQNVTISIPDLKKYTDHTPVLVDDIISTGQTMLKTLYHLKVIKTKAPTCIGVHAIFADITTSTLLQAGAGKVITCNTITHDSNGIDVSQLIYQTIKDLPFLAGENTLL